MQSIINPGTSATSPRFREGRPSTLACDACRRKHLKCDAASPVCRRCAVEKLDCTYTPSRRGLARRNLKGTRRSGHQVDTAATSANAPSSSANNAYDDVFMQDLDTSGQPSALSAGHQTRAVQDTASNTVPTTWSLCPSERERLLGLFYSHFHGAHPFMAPKAFYSTQAYPYYPELVICFVGLRYARPVPKDAAALCTAVSAAMSEATDETTVHRTQALILLSIVDHGDRRSREAASCVARAARIASDLGMHDPNFARANARGSPVREESLRRTWWELHIVDVYMAAINRSLSFETASAPSMPLLPCAESIYEAGQCDTAPPSLQTFNNRILCSADPNSAHFASLCFRIGAIRIVARVLTNAAKDNAHPDNIQALDNALASWHYNLPSEYKDVVGATGEVDPMLFQARTSVLCASIFLHFPRSDLPATVPSASEIDCAKGYTPLVPTSRHHAIKAIAASKEMANLATLPWPLEQQSPYFICGLILSCIVQLGAGLTHLHQCGLDCLQQHKDRVELVLGALQGLGEYWSLASSALCSLRQVSETALLASQRETSTSTSLVNGYANDGAFNASEGSANPLWFDLFAIEDLQPNFFDV